MQRHNTEIHLLIHRQYCLIIFFDCEKCIPLIQFITLLGISLKVP